MIFGERVAIGRETVIALGEAAKDYEGSYTEADDGITITFNTPQGKHTEMKIPAKMLPSDEYMKDIFIAHHIRKAVRKMKENNHE